MLKNAHEIRIGDLIVPAGGGPHPTKVKGISWTDAATVKIAVEAGRDITCLGIRQIEVANVPPMISGDWDATAQTWVVAITPGVGHQRILLGDATLYNGDPEAPAPEVPEGTDDGVENFLEDLGHDINAGVAHWGDQDEDDEPYTAFMATQRARVRALIVAGIAESHETPADVVARAGRELLAGMGTADEPDALYVRGVEHLVGKLTGRQGADVRALLGLDR